VSRTTYIYRNGDSFSYAGGSDPSCATASTSDSFYSHGVWLLNTCFDSQIADAFYRVSVPGAVRYTHLGLSVYGYAFDPPSEMGAGYGVGGNDGAFGIGGPTTITGSGEGWYYLGGVGAGYVRSDHTVLVAPFVDSAYWASDFDIAQIRLGVTYDVLQ
jgi:hypothetical protein